MVEQTKNPIFTEDFPYIWEQHKLPEGYELEDLLEGDNWDIIPFTNFEATRYLYFLYSFDRYVQSDFELDKTFELYEYYREENDEEEQFFVIIQGENFYQLDLKRMIEAYNND